jgi:Xaa-Pro aminopeptidase
MVEPDFPDSEFEARVDKAQAAMRTAGLDALLFTTEAEFRYFSGFRTLFWQSPTRPWFLIVPANGKPVAVIPEIGAVLMRATWIDDIRTWASPVPEDDGISLLASALEGTTRLGMPMGRESSLRMPLADFERLRAMLSGTEFLDATPLVARLRMVKSEAEIDRIGQICAIASRAFERAPDLFHAGQSLSEAFRAFKIELLRQGADDVPYLVGGTGQPAYGDVISPPDATPLKLGDVLMLDTGACLDGYFCDFDRNFAFGHADERAFAAHRTLFKATEAGLAAARPGATCADVFQAMAQVIADSGSGNDPGDGDVGRLGHGLGMQLTEAPSLTGFDTTVLEPGMVLTLEPSLAISPGAMMVHEENIVVRDGPPQLLSTRVPADLPVI